MHVCIRIYVYAIIPSNAWHRGVYTYECKLRLYGNLYKCKRAKYTGPRHRNYFHNPRYHLS